MASKAPQQDVSSVAGQQVHGLVDENETLEEKRFDPASIVVPATRLALEPRYMFDAAGAVAAVDVASETVAAEQAAAFVDATFVQKTVPDAPSPAASRALSFMQDEPVFSRIDISQRWADYGRDGETETPHRGMTLAGVRVDAGDSEAAIAEIDPGFDEPRADRVEIVFIDSAVADAQQLIESLDRPVEVVFISAQHDGLAQIEAALDGRSDVDAVHILAHGQEGFVRLGTSVLDKDSIAGQFADALANIGASLDADGDILVYGCRFGEGEAGTAAVRALADATGADIAASDDDTGIADLGGDWKLETRFGLVETLALASDSWNALLAPATISVDGNPIVFDSDGNVVTGATTEVGVFAVWRNAGTVGGNAIDLRATVLTRTAQDAVTFGTAGDDASVFITSGSGGSRDQAQVTVRWQMFRAGTTTPISGDVSYTVTDVDGIRGTPNSREVVTVSTDQLQSFTTATTTNIAIDSRPGVLEASGRQNQSSGQQPGWVRFNWVNLSSWEITYTLVRNNVAQGAQFVHDGDGDRSFTGDGVTRTLPRLDLDANNSTAEQTAADFTYNSQSTPIAVVDTDVDITEASTVNRGTLVLTNAQAGDRLEVVTADLPAGVTATVDESVPGRITVRFSGTASDSEYEQALRAVRFSNVDAVPSTTPRQIEVRIDSDPFVSNTAISTINVAPLSRQPVLDLNGPESDVSAIAWTHNSPPNSRDATVRDSSVIVSGQADIVGPGITATFSGTIGRIDNADTDNFADARASGDYMEYRFRTGDTLPDFAAITRLYNTDFRNSPPFKIAVEISSDNFATSQVLSQDFEASPPGGGRFDPNFNDITDFRLDAATDYQIRVYIYDTGGQEVIFDDFAISTVARDLDYSTSYVENGPSVAIGDTDSFVFDEDDTNMESGNVVLTNPVAGDRFVIGGTAVADGDTGTIGDISYTVTEAGGQISIALTGSATKVAYAEAIAQIRFESTSDDPTAADRIVESTVNDGDVDSPVATTTIEVTPVNDAPIATDDGPVSVTEDTPATGNVLANDSDVDGGPLRVTQFTIAGQTVNAGGTANIQGVGTLRISANGDFTFTPAANYTGPVPSAVYTVSDGAGGTDTATLSFADVTDVPDDVSVFAPTNRTTSEDQQVQFGGGADGIRIADNDAGLVSVTVTATNGTATLGNSNGVTFVSGDGTNDQTFTISGTPAQLNTVLASLRFNPTPDYNGPASLLIEADDGQSTDSATIAINVTPQIDIQPDNAVTREDQPVIISVLGNDSFEGNPQITATTDPANGSVTINGDGTITYTPDADFNGNDSFTYTVTSGGVTETTTVNVQVQPGNDAPTTMNRTETISEDTTYNFTPADFPFADIDGDSFQLLRIDTLPSDGVLLLNGNPIAVGTTISAGQASQLSFRPDMDETGAPYASFKFSVGDGQTFSDSATFTFAVTPENDAPDAGVLPDLNNLDGESVTVAAGDAFSDADGDALTFTATGLPPGLSIDSASGAITGVIDSSASQGSPYTVTVTASDGTASDSTSFTWTIANPAPTAIDDTASTDEDTPVNINVLANDVDPDGDSLTVTAAIAANGTVSIAPNGALIYTPSQDFTGTDTITYTISDGEGGTSTALVTVTIDPVDDAPVLNVPGAQGVEEDDRLLLAQVTNNAITVADADGDDITLTLSAANGTLTFAATSGLTFATGDGTDDAAITVTGSAASLNAALNGMRFTPTADYNGPALIDVTISDGTSSVSDRIDINVTPVVDIAADTYTTPEDTPAALSVFDNDTFEGTPEVTSFTQGANGTVTLNADGTGTYTPSANFNGTDSFTYTVTSGGVTETTTVTITVDGENDAPAGSDIADQNAVDGQPITLDVSDFFADDDGDPLSFTATGLPPGLSISAAGVISGTLDNSASQGGPGSDGFYSVTVTANDGRGGTVTETFTYTVVNALPTAVNDSATVVEDTPTTINVLGNDSDPDNDDLTVTEATAGNGTVTINADGTLEYTPNSDFTGTDTIIYRISDGEGGESTASVTVTVTSVNDDPVTEGIDPQADADGSTVSLDISDNFSDVDGDTLTFTATGLPNGLTLDPATGIISGTVDADASTLSPYSVTITADDGNGGTVSTSFVWSFENVPPIAMDDLAMTAEDTAVIIDVLVNDSDPDNDTLTVIEARAPNGTVTIDPVTNRITYTPDEDFNGTDTINYRISDGQGGFSTATVTVTVTAVNDAPELNEPLPNEAGIDGQSGISLDLAPFFDDVDGDSLTFSATGLPPGLSIDANGVITGTLDSSASTGGPYTVTVTAQDPDGATVSSTFTYDVANPPLQANPDGNAVGENGSLTVNAANGVLVNDSDPDGDDLSVAEVEGDAGNVGAAVAGSAGGTFTLASDGSYTFTTGTDFDDLSEGETRTTSIVYLASDGEGGTSTATLTITVTGTNDTSVISPDAQTTPEDQPVSGRVTATDAEGDALTFAVGDAPDNGSVTVAPDGTYTYTPDPDFNGTDTFTVTVDDGNGGTATTTVTIIVTPQNDAPVAIDETIATDEDTPISDAIIATDVDGDDLTYSVATPPANGTLVLNPDGTYTYTPNANFNGTDRFVVEVSDGNGGTDLAVISVNVAPVNDAPVAGNIDDRLNNDGDAILVATAAAFSDVDGDDLSYSAADLPPGLSIDADTGQITGTLASSASQDGPYTVTVTASDGVLSDSATFTWTVANPAPTAVDDSFTVAEDRILTGNVRANDGDPDGDTLTVDTNLVSGPSQGTVTLAADGSFTYTPNANANGTDSFQYRLIDADGASSIATVSINIDAVNDAPVAVNDSATTDEDTPVTIDVIGNDTDVDGDTLRVTTVDGQAISQGSPVTLADGSVVSLGADGRLTITPPADGTAPIAFTYGITDDNGGTDAARVEIAVTPVNDAPTGGDNRVTTAEDTDYVFSSGDFPFADIDADDALTTVRIDTLPAEGTLTLNGVAVAAGDEIDAADIAAGLLRFVPDADENGTDYAAFMFSVGDGDAFAPMATMTINVTPVNDAPTLDAVLGNQNGNDDEAITPFSVADAFSDGDGDTLTFSATGLPPGLTINAAGEISGTPDRDASTGSPYLVEVTATDPDGETVTASFTYDIANPAPVATASADQDNVDGDVVTLDISGAFADPDGDTLTYDAAGLPAGLTIDMTTGVISGSLNTGASAGSPYTVTLTADDGEGGITSTTFAWTIDNPAPTAGAIPAQISVDAAVFSLDISTAFADSDGDTLSYSVTGLPAGLTIDPATGVISGMIDNSASIISPYPVTVTATDADGAAASSSFLFSVDNVVPATTGIPNQEADDSDVISLATGPFFTDADGDDLVYTVSGLPSGLTIDRDTGLITGTLAGDASASEPYTVTVTVNDGEGGSTLSSFILRVGEVSPALIGELPDVTEVAGDTIINIDTSSVFVDPDGDPLTYEASGLPPGIDIDPNTGIISGTLTNGASADGPYSVVVSASDGTDISLDTFTFTVTNPVPVLDTPLADQANQDGETVSIDISGSFSDPDADVLTYSATGLPPGISIDPATGVISGTISPSAGRLGPFMVIATATDAQGDSASDLFTWTVTNPAPVAVDDMFVTDEDVAIDIDVLANDMDSDGDTLQLFTVEGVTLGIGDSLTLDSGAVITRNPDGTLNVLPPPDSNEDVVFSYVVADADGAQDEGQVTITVTPVNDAPTGDDNAITTAEDTDYVFAAADFPFADVDDGDALDQVRIDTLPTDGVLFLAGTEVMAGDVISAADIANGDFVFRPDMDENGAPYSAFTFSVGDGELFAATPSTITVDVTPVADAPVADDVTATTLEDEAVTIDPIGASTDADGDPLSITQVDGQDIAVGMPVTLADGTIVSLNPDGTLDVTPAADSNEPISFIYTVSDPGGLTDTGQADIAVTPVNDAPVAGDVDAETEDGTPVIIDPIGASTDVDADELTITQVAGTPIDIDNPVTLDDGTIVSLNPDGTLTVTPPEDGNDSIEFTYTVSDPDGATDQGNVTITVDLTGVVRGADVGALLAFSFNEIADTPRAETIRREALPPFIEVPGAVIDTVFSLRDLNSLAALGAARAPIMAAINDMADLNGTEDLMSARHPIEAVVESLTDLTLFADRYQEVFGDDAARFDIPGLTGFSLRYPTGDGEQLIIVESVRRGAILLMNIETPDINVTGYDIIRTDGRALPGWIKVEPRGMVFMEPPADAETINLTIRAEREQGGTISRDIQLDLPSGEIQPADQGDGGDWIRASVETLTEQIDTAANAGGNDNAALGRALGE